ncbi:hypothetical protein Goklo_023844, partial [Gossypium klotzschianum]|nr:hypothetical protein [Gossypium klotzschianum]
MHAILKCGPANEVYSQLGLQWVTDPSCDSLWYGMAYIFQMNDVIGCSKILTTMWMLWHARNKFVMEERLPEMQRTMLSKWLPSEKAIVKINFDAAFKQNLHQSCLSFVIRNDLGPIMESGSILNSNVVDTFSTKALACLQALTFAKDTGFSQVVIEGDSRMTIMKAHRDSNTVAHTIAKNGFKLGNSHFWVEDVPYEAAKLRWLKMTVGHCRFLKGLDSTIACDLLTGRLSEFW